MIRYGIEVTEDQSRAMDGARAVINLDDIIADDGPDPVLVVLTGVADPESDGPDMIYLLDEREVRAILDALRRVLS